MRKNKLFRIAALSLVGFAATGCASAGQDSATPEVDFDKLSQTEKVDYMLEKMEQGFTMNGTITQKQVVYELQPNGQNVKQQEQTQTYRFEGFYENSKDSVGGIINQYGKIGELETIIDHVGGYLDKDGNVYSEYLDYKNTVQVKYSKEGYDILSYTAAGIFNFATILNSNDFNYISATDDYDVNISKMGFIFKNMFGHKNTGFFHSPTSVTAKVENNMFSHMEAEIEPFKTQKVEENSFVTREYFNSLSFDIKNVGTTKLPRVETYPNNPANATLDKALDKIGNNFTVDVESSIGKDEGSKHNTYRKYKFDGSKILVQDYEGRSHANDEPTAKNSFVLKTLDDSESSSLYSHVLNEQGNYIMSDHVKFPGIYQGRYSYDEIIYRPGEISSDFFKYDNFIDEYIVEDPLIVEQIIPYLMINVAPLAHQDAQNAYKIGVRLTENNEISYIKFYVNYVNLLENTKIAGTVKTIFSNVGATTI